LPGVRADQPSSVIKLTSRDLEVLRGWPNCPGNFGPRLLQQNDQPPSITGEDPNAIGGGRMARPTPGSRLATTAMTAARRARFEPDGLLDHRLRADRNREELLPPSAGPDA